MPIKGDLMDKFSGSSSRGPGSPKKLLFVSHHFSPSCFILAPDGRKKGRRTGDKLEEQAPWREALGVGVGVGILGVRRS